CTARASNASSIIAALLRGGRDQHRAGLYPERPGMDVGPQGACAPADAAHGDPPRISGFTAEWTIERPSVLQEEGQPAPASEYERFPQCSPFCFEDCIARVSEAPGP